MKTSTRFARPCEVIEKQAYHELGHIVDFEDSINRGLQYEAEHFADEFVFQHWVWEEINLLYPESKAISDILDHYKNPVTLH